MDAVAVHDPREFLDRAGPMLLLDETRHNLIFAVCQTLLDAPEMYERFHLWVVEDDRDEVAGAAAMTPPYNLIVAKPREEAVIEALARRLHQDGIEVPGVTAALPEVDAFVETWTALQGVGARQELAQGIYQLSEVRPASGVTGSLRRAGPADRALVMEWLRAFGDEALPERDRDPARLERAAGARLERRGGAFFLWEDEGEPVSIAGHSSETPHGVRIGPVYTPPELRGRGYAGALVSQLSEKLLRSGRRFCFLYTDLSNPVSNRLYERIGYELVCESAEYSFALR